MKPIYKLIYLAIPLLLTSCIKDGFDKENCPGDLVIIPIKPDPDGTGPGNEELEETKTIIIMPDGSSKEITVGSSESIDLEEGDYTVVSVKSDNIDNVVIEGTNVSAILNPDGTIADPGELVGGYSNIHIGGSTSGDTPSFNVPTHYQTRPLLIKVRFIGRNVQMLEGLDGEVEGIAASRDLNNGFPPIDGEPRHPVALDGKVAYPFNQLDSPTRAVGEAEQNFQSESRRLLGIDGEAEQSLSLNVTFEGSIDKKYIFDIARDMDNFHIEEVTKPWIIQVTLRLGADFEATIEDWKAGPESWMDAE